MYTRKLYNQQSRGVKCQRCEHNINMDINTIHCCASVICPLCGLRHNPNQEAYEEGLTALYHLKNGLDRRIE